MELYEDLRRACDEDDRALVVRDRQDQRVTLTLADPDRLNSLSAGLTVQLQQHLEDIASDPGVRTVMITGRDPAFSAGGDLKMIRDGSQAIRDAGDPSDTTDPWRWIRRQFGG